MRRSEKALGIGAIAALGLSFAAMAVADATDSTGLDGARPTAGPMRPLVVCADPNNLPFSNRAGQGFENRIAELLSKDMGKKLEYVWWAQRRGFVRNTLGAAKCEVWPGVAQGVERVAATHPYYRSTYVFVTRADEPLQGLTLDDARLRSVAIGVQMIGNDGMNTPPAHAIARRGLTQNVRGYMLYGDYNHPNPPAAIIDAVAKGDIDVGIAWGPLAGFFASRSTAPLRIEPVTPAMDGGVWPMAYDISIGVRRDDPELQRRIDVILEKEKPAIDAILRNYHVPVVGECPSTCAANGGPQPGT